MALTGSVRRLCGVGRFLQMQQLTAVSPFQHRLISSFFHTTDQLLSSCWGLGEKGKLLQASPPLFLPWRQQQIRTKKRGMEYQPKALKRIRTHGWLKRISSRGGIEVILRRMLKGRKSLTH
ncbi:39S ribosomal protein L34, mitochondrial [Rhinatrema bivittatum]|uniref:39S ribosomal protein L34, mitochondrial n=1 Tax=Rhinatrema bivittatum TaxID=194408 RepID=UPI00112AE6EE|nr:39S ribosomal protein L34, mitochondrial [Rhinatrema bivittatum]